MNLTTAVTRVANRWNKNANDTTVATRIKTQINDTCLEKWNGYAWSFRYREYPLVMSPRVTSGTLTATNGSRTVTASGTPFIANTHEGAWIRFTADTVQALYRVQTVNSTSSITIEPAYQGTTGASKAYTLDKTDYLLPAEISDVSGIRITSSMYEIPLRYMNATDASQFPPITGNPSEAYIFNQAQRSTSYSTGTVSGTTGTTTITGVGTAWLANLTPGDDFLINGDTNTYTVFAVDSDTSLQLYQKLLGTASGATYAASRQFGKVIRLFPSADQSYVYYVRALRKYPLLINNADTNELLQRFPHAVVEGSGWREASSSPDPRASEAYARSEMLWARAMGEDEQLFAKSNPAPIWNPYGAE